MGFQSEGANSEGGGQEHSKNNNVNRKKGNSDVKATADAWIWNSPIDDFHSKEES